MLSASFSLDSVVVNRKCVRIISLPVSPGQGDEVLRFLRSPFMISLTMASTTNSTRVRTPDAYRLQRAPTDMGVCNQQQPRSHMMGSTQSCSGDGAVRMTKDRRVDNPDMRRKIRLATRYALTLNGTGYVTSRARELGGKCKISLAG